MKFEMLAPALDEKPILNLKYRHFDHRIRDLRVIGTWILTDQRHPCLVIVPANRPLHKVTPCIVQLRNAWLWTEDAGDPVQCALIAMDFCGVLDKSPMNTSHVVQIMDAVRSRLHDLLLMPPAPPMERRAAGVTKIVVPDGPTSEKEIWEDV